MGDIVQVVTREGDLILNLLRALADNTRPHVHTTDNQFTQKVTDFDQRAFLDLLAGLGVLSGEVDLDGEMSMTVGERMLEWVKKKKKKKKKRGEVEEGKEDTSNEEGKKGGEKKT